MATNRGWMISAVLFGGIGVIFLLWGLGVDLGRWWPAFFAIIGLASLVRGIRERENLVFGFLLIGWSAIAIVSLHSPDIEFIRSGWFFFIGASIVWIPIAWLLGRAMAPETGR
jgi:hypothetical protein